MYQWLLERFREAIAIAGNQWEKEFIQRVFQMVQRGRFDKAILELELVIEEIEAGADLGSGTGWTDTHGRRHKRYACRGFGHSSGEGLKVALGALHFFSEFDWEDYFQNED